MKNFKFLLNLLMFVASVLTGGGAIMAESVITALPDAGSTISSPTSTPVEGAFTLNKGSEAEPDLFMADVDERITKMRPMSTPLDQISRRAGRATKCDSMEVEYYSVGTRPIQGEVSKSVSLSGTNDRFTVELVDDDMIDIQDTVRFVGVNGYKEDGTVDTGVDFVALVIDVDGSGHKIFQPINAKTSDGKGNPAIPAGTKIVRMGRAAAELDVQSAVFSNVPGKESQYCQIFVMQVEESNLAKIGKKEVPWNLSDLEEDSIYDMRTGMEGSFLFGIKRKRKHVKSKDLVYTTGGIYWMVGKKINVGTYNSTAGETEISDNQLVDYAKEMFTGTGVGNKRKVAFMGSDMMAAFSKIKASDGRMTIRENVEVWDLKFKSFDTNFGEILAIHSEMMDLQGKSDEALVFDPEFLSKRIHKGWSRDTYNMKELAIRNTNAVVLSEISCLYLRYPKAHSVLKLVAAPIAAESIELNKETLSIVKDKTDSSLVVSFTPSDTTDKSITWTSSAPTYATVSANGVVTGVAAGESTITATSKNNKTATCVVTVTAS